MEEGLKDKKKHIVEFFLNNSLLISSEFLEEINNTTNEEELLSLVYSKLSENDSIEIGDELVKIKEILDIKPSEREGEESENHQDKKEIPEKGNVKVIFSYDKESKKRGIQDFVSFFNSRYKLIRKILLNRHELQNVTSIGHLSGKKEKESVSLIGIITNKQTTKNNNILLTIEDPTGSVRICVTKNKPELHESAKECVLDEVIGITGMTSQDIIFVNNIFFPDVPVFNEIKKSPVEEYAIFTSDLHFGSKVFFRENFLKFIKWLRGETGTEEQRQMVKKIKYLLIAGDVVEGVGIYPRQENDLEIQDIYKQYEEVSKYFKLVPEHINIIVCAGNHDAMRISEPQPPLYQDFAEHLWSLPNIHIVSNPSMVNIGSTDSFPGFDVLLYHGFSFPYYADMVESIRTQGGLRRADLIMKLLLKKRHLAPTHQSTLYLPDSDQDYLVIEKIPDFFVTGHIHRVSAINYRNITCLNCSSWVDETEYQKKRGLSPEPCRALLVNLQTRKVKIMNFN